MKSKINLKDTAWIIVFLCILVSFVILLINLSSSKINNGYYLNQYIGGQTSIWINWDNRLDEKVFQHPDINTVLQVYSQLNAQLKGQVIQPKQSDE